MINCRVLNKDKKKLNSFWDYIGIYENRRRRIEMEDKWVKEMIEKDKWKYIM